MTKVNKADTKIAPKTINWDDVHRRIADTEIAIKKGFQPNSEERDSILKSRAKILARETKEKAEKGEYIEVLEFLLSHETYAVELKYIREVYPLNELTPVPMTPPFVLGIINVRGEILSVIDIKKFFDLPEKGLTNLNKVIIIYSDEMEFGILADSILGVHNILTGNIQTSLPTLTGIREEYLKGVTKERVVILDAGKLLSDKGIIVNESVKV